MNYYAVERSGNHLEHYGVKGMRWGVRKDKEKSDIYNKLKNKLKSNIEKKTVKYQSDYLKSSGNLAADKKTMRDISGMAMEQKSIGN